MKLYSNSILEESPNADRMKYFPFNSVGIIYKYDKYGINTHETQIAAKNSMRQSINNSCTLTCKTKILVHIRLLELIDKTQIIVTLENIEFLTEKVRKLKNQNLLKDQNLATITHDLRNPLSSILKILNNLLSGEISDEKIQNIKMAISISELLQSLVNDILDFNLIQQNKLRLHIQRFNCSQLLNDVVGIMNIQAQQKRIELIIKNNLQFQALIQDSKRIKQILLNLISNSLKFTDQGSITIKVKETQKGIIKFSIIDTGSGIESDKISSLQQKFSTFGSPSYQNSEGIGLGLFFCKQIAQAIGPLDSLIIKSTVNVGSKFSFLVYQKIADLNDNYQTRQSHTSQHHLLPSLNQELQERLSFSISTRKKSIFSIMKNQESKLYQYKKINILIVDDSQFNLYALQTQLALMKQLGDQNVLSAFNGKQAIQIFKEKNKQQNPDNINVIILDCEMPIMNGYDACSKIKLLIKQKSYIACPIIANSANTNQESIDRCKTMGFDKIISKDVSYQKLEKIIQKLI